MMAIYHIGYWTLDNASNNGTFMDELSILLQSCDINFNTKDHKIMCFSHIYCQHVIADFTDTDFVGAAEDSVATFPPGNPDLQTIEEAVRWDSVALGCNIVCVIWNTGQQCNAFNDLVRDGNGKGWFAVGDPPVCTELPLWQLLHDIATR